MKVTHIAIVAATLVALAPSPVIADAVADFYRGKTVSIVIAAGPGGNHSRYSQLLSPHLQKYMPGNPKFINRNMGGAGGTKAANYLYNVAPKDGTYIGILLAGTPMSSRLRATGIKYNPKNFQYLGGADRTRDTLAVWKTAGVNTLDEAKIKSVVLGASGKGSKTFVIPTTVNALLGTKFKVILGYKGMSGIEMAMEKNEVQGRLGVWASMKNTRPHWIANDLVVHLAIADLEPEQELPGVPRLIDLAKNEADRKVFELVTGNGILGRAWLAPPGVPADRVAALRAAFWKAINDPEVAAETKKRRMALKPMPWQVLQANAARIADTDDKVIARTKKLLGLK